MASGYQGAVGQFGEAFVDQAMALVFPFRPRVGKIDVQGGDGMEWEQVFEEVGRFDPDAAQVRRAGAPGLAVHFSNATQETFDADEIMSGLLSGPGHQERAVTAAQLHLERLHIWEKVGEIEPLENRRQVVDQARRAYRREVL